MTDDADPDVLDEALRRRLLGYADDCARDVQATAARVTLVATSLDALFEVTGSGSPTDTTQVWALSVEAGSEPFDLAPLGQPDVLRASDADSPSSPT